ncbi:MAG: hypothetical protein ACLVCH_12725 [Roseburia inulinivorans]
MELYIGPVGLYYSSADGETKKMMIWMILMKMTTEDDDDMITDIGDMEFSTEVPAGGADSSFDVSSIRNIKLDIDAAEITVKEPDDSEDPRCIKHGKEKYYSAD